MFLKIFFFISFVLFNRSPEWKNISEQDKASLGLTFAHDGEFWLADLILLIIY